MAVIEQRKGILKVKAVLKRTDPAIIKGLYERINFETGYAEKEEKFVTLEEVKDMMSYNVWTVDQFCWVSGLSISSVNNLTRPYFTGEGPEDVDVKLDICYPFADPDGKGPKFIVRNAKSEKYIKL